MTDISTADVEIRTAGDESSDMYRCRMYENVYPEPEEIVMVNVVKIGEMGAYVKLLEYNNIDVNTTLIAIQP
jgi:hypothetical protein